jgi:hypothetical protein
MLTTNGADIPRHPCRKWILYEATLEAEPSLFQIIWQAAEATGKRNENSIPFSSFDKNQLVSFLAFSMMYSLSSRLKSPSDWLSKRLENQMLIIRTHHDVYNDILLKSDFDIVNLTKNLELLIIHSNWQFSRSEMRQTFHRMLEAERQSIAYSDAEREAMANLSKSFIESRETIFKTYVHPVPLHARTEWDDRPPIFHATKTNQWNNGRLSEIHYGQSKTKYYSRRQLRGKAELLHKRLLS